MKNILFIHSSSELYGSDRSLLNIIKNLDKTKYKPYVILPCEGPLVDEMKKISEVSVEIFEIAVLRRKNLSIRGGLEYFKQYRKSIKYVKKFIREHSIEIVDTNTAVVFPGAIAAKRMKVKNVWHIREIIKSNLENKVISFIMNRYADVIIANSKATGKALNVNQDKVRVVYNAVEETIEQTIAPHDGMVVGMAGRINRWKGQKLFVDAAKIVHDKYPNVVFQIAGDTYVGEDYIKQELKEYISENELEDTVLLLGQVNNMSKFYSGLDVFVLPSIQPEPFGLVVIEAMEYSIPVIATNHGGPTEIINDGIDGYLVDYNDASEMAGRICELVKDSDKCREMGRKAQEKKRELFSVASMVKSIEKIFEQM